MAPHRAPTQAMVAKRAGVSQSAVSLVFVGGNSVSEELRRKVQKAAEELGYFPDMNVEARRLTSRRQTNRPCAYRTIGLLWSKAALENGGGSLAHMIMQGTIQACSRRNLALLVYSLDLQDPSQWPPLGQVDGVILPHVTRGIHEIATRRGLPVVGLYVAEENFPCTLVSVNNHSVMHLAVGHLHGCGHRDIAYLGLPPTDGLAGNRHSAFLTALRDHSLSLNNEWIVCHHYPVHDTGSQWYREMGMHAFTDLWKSKPHPTAIVAYNDAMAHGIYDAARNLRLTIGRDVSVIGIDGLTEMNLLHPGLTSVSVGFERMAETAVTEILRVAAGGKHRHAIIEIEPELIVRESVSNVQSKSSLKKKGSRPSQQKALNLSH